MERTFLKKMLAIGLSAAMAFTAAPFLAQNTQAIEAEAADTLTVTYTVQINQNENMFSSIMSSINAARAPKTSAENNADSSGTTTSASGTDLVYNGDIEQFAIDRAQDLALYNTTDGTKSNGDSEMTADAERAEVEAFVTYSGALNSTPADDWSKNASVLNTEYKSAGIGHVTYADQEFYCIVLSKNPKPSKNTVNYAKTQISQVQNYLAYNNVGKIYAKYSYNGSSDFTPVEFVDGNGLSTAKYPGTINVTYGQSAEIPTLKYAVSPKNVSGASSDSVYEISQPAASPTVNDSNGISVSGNQVTGKTIGSYTVSYVDSVAGKKTSFDIPVTVAAADLSGGTMTVDNSKKYYANGTASEPDVTIRVGDKILTKDTDYTLAYANNNPATSVTNPQKATITATGKGNYTGTLTGDFTIQPSTGGDLTGATITVTEKNIVYDGKEKKPKATVVLNGVTVPESSYTLKYSNNVKAGTATIVAAAKSGDERYSKTAKGTFKIAQADLSTADFTFADSDNKSNTSPQYSYTGADIKPEPGIKVGSETLKKNTDFTYSYSNNKSIGTTATVTITGKGNYTGTAFAYFEITQGNLAKATITPTPSTFTYNGQKQYPAVVVVSIGSHQLVQGRDYTISAFPNSVDAGTYNFTITGINNFKGTDTTTAFIGTLPYPVSAEEFGTRLPEGSSVEIVSASKEQTNIFVLCYDDVAQETEDALRKNSFASVSENEKFTPAELTEQMMKRCVELEKQRDEAVEKIKKLAENRQQLKFAVDYLAMRKDKYEALSALGFTENTFVLTGFIPEKYCESLRKEIEKKHTAYIEFTDPTDEDDVPVLLENGRFSAPVEGITKMYAMPSKDDVDPTPVMAFFYYLFFGMMLSDAGYGLLMVIGTTFALKKFRLEDSMKKTLTMFRNCGISTVIWGALFGSWFGDIVQVVGREFFGREIGSIALWFQPLDDPIKLLLFSFGLGILHLFLGVAVSFHMSWKDGRKLDAFCDSVPVYLTVLGVAPLGAGILTEVPAVLKTIGSYMMIAGVILLVLTAGRSSKSIFGKFFGGLYALYNTATGYLSDILSYSRLLALGLATGSIASVINLIGTMPENKIVKLVLLIVVFAVGHTANLAINLLGAYVHTDRLQFVELFSKFYTGGGREFQPLTVNTKYIKFKEENIND